MHESGKWKVESESEAAQACIVSQECLKKTKIVASSLITSWQIGGKEWLTLLFWAPKSLQMVTAAMKLKDACSLGEKL